MQQTVDRFTVYLPTAKKRQLNAILAAKGEKLTEFFAKIIDDVIENNKDSAIKALKKAVK